MTAQAIIDMLADHRFENVFNPWRDLDPMDASPYAAFLRTENLRAHFNCDARFLLIGEAPGYQGCHFSGIPFTSERLLQGESIPRVADGTRGQGRMTTRKLPWSEPSATIIWKALHAAGIAEQVVLWNAFAWHPHKPGNVYSNRTPTQREIHAGFSVLLKVVVHFPAARVVAIGKTAERTLQPLGIKVAASIRHPANGGARECREGILRLASTTRGDSL